MFAQKCLLFSFWTYIRDGLSSSWAIVFSYCHLLFPFWMEVSVSVSLLRGLCSLLSLVLSLLFTYHQFLVCLFLFVLLGVTVLAFWRLWLNIFHQFQKVLRYWFSNIAFAPVSHLFPFETVNTFFVPSPHSFWTTYNVFNVNFFSF